MVRLPFPLDPPGLWAELGAAVRLVNDAVSARDVVALAHAATSLREMALRNMDTPLADDDDPPKAAP